MENYRKIDGFEQVLVFLKSNRIVVCFSQNEKKYFRKQKEKIMVVEPYCRYFLTEVQFEELFSQENFYVEMADQETVFDFSRDEEYYRWKHK